MSQRIKILHLASSLSVGGAEQLLLGISERHNRRRFEMHIGSLSVVRGNALQPDFECLNLPLTTFNAKRFYDLNVAFKVAQYVRQHQIDIIHTHLIDADVIGRIVGRLLGRVVISTLQNEPHDYDRKRFDYRWLEHITARYLTTHLVAVSEHIRTMFIKDWGIPTHRISTIYNAVPMEQYLGITEDLERTEQECPLITNIGRLSPQKGQQYLLQAAKLVLEQQPDVRFMIVGQGRLEQSLKEQAQTLGIADRITFSGLRRDIPNVLAQSDIFVLPSLWEGLPLTAVEAMAAARPVVLTDVGGNRELVDSGVNGIILPRGDVEVLAHTLLTLLSDEQQRRSMGRAARERVQHDFNIDVITGQYETLYETLINQRRKVVQKAQVSGEL